jgi:hypothetical protein
VRRGRGVLPETFFFSSQAFGVDDEIANTEVQAKQKLDQQIWRYKDFK